MLHLTLIQFALDPRQYCEICTPWSCFAFWQQTHKYLEWVGYKYSCRSDPRQVEQQDNAEILIVCIMLGQTSVTDRKQSSSLCLSGGAIKTWEVIQNPFINSLPWSYIVLIKTAGAKI